MKEDREKKNGPTKSWCREVAFLAAILFSKFSFPAVHDWPSKKGTTVLIQSVCTWSTSCSHIGVLKQWNIGHVGALNRSCGSSTQTLSFFSNKFAWLLDTWLHALYSRGGEDLWLGCTYWIIYRTVHKWRGKTFWQIQNSFLNCTAGRSWQAFYTMAQRHPHMRLKLMYNSLV